ncbi:hypothetical protein Tsubulata_034203 [Turnera subulata]|uniref:Subtilisin-like protease fibronectin type-III domain-containing protein n=1 Tax=Turnera subulata TaxID=218843 RepID=A0A9Q0F2K9_9ROSI|nr:hypothetical protein Tsubulata_034203 [Turnera subulata]
MVNGKIVSCDGINDGEEAIATGSPAAIKSGTNDYSCLNECWQRHLRIRAHRSSKTCVDPGLVYDAGEIDYVKFLCGQGELSQNVGPATSSYKAIINTPQAGLKISVSPDVLSFTSVGQKLSFQVSVKANVDVSTSLSGSLVWDDGVHQVRTPVVAFLDTDDGTAPQSIVGFVAGQDSIGKTVFSTSETLTLLFSIPFQGVSISTFVPEKSDYPIIYGGDAPNRPWEFNPYYSRKIVYCDNIADGKSQLPRPDLTAPGVDILAAWTEATTPTGDEWDKGVVPNYNIVSAYQEHPCMPCPHATGAAAYVKSFHPTWSPAAH